MPACVVRPGACVHVGIRRVRTHMGVWHGRGDPAGTGRRSIPHMKAWKPACNVFAMKKGRQ